MGKVVERLRDALNHSLSSDRKRQTAQLREIIEELDAWEFVEERLRDALADDRVLGEVGVQSLHHPNGFDQLLLLESPTKTGGLADYRVRLHIWWPDQARPVQDIHNHGWDYASRVLCGRLRFRTFHFDEDPAEPVYHRYWLNTGDEKISPRGSGRVTLGLDALFDAGTAYTFDHRVFHDVAPVAAGLTATLVLAGRYARLGSEMLLEERRLEQGAESFQCDFVRDEPLRQLIRRWLAA